jgi:hypothetical protein
MDKVRELLEQAAFERHVAWGVTGNLYCSQKTFDKCESVPCRQVREALASPEAAPAPLSDVDGECMGDSDHDAFDKWWDKITITQGQRDGAVYKDCEVAFYAGLKQGRTAPSPAAGVDSTGEPWAFTIETPGGDMEDGEYAVFSDRRSAQEHVDELNEELLETEERYKVVPLFRQAALQAEAPALPPRDEKPIGQIEQREYYENVRQAARKEAREEAAQIVDGMNVLSAMSGDGLRDPAIVRADIAKAIRALAASRREEK